MRAPCRIRALDSLGEAIAGETVDWSQSGFAVHAGRCLAAGTPVEVLLVQPEGEPVCWYGRVMHARRVASGTFLLGILVDGSLRESAPDA